MFSCRLFKSSSGEKDSSNSQKSRSTVEKVATDSSSNYKALLKVWLIINVWFLFSVLTCKHGFVWLQSYQEQLKETKAQREELRTEIQRLKEDLESRLRPDFWRFYYRVLQCPSTALHWFWMYFFPIPFSHRDLRKVLVKAL